MFDAAIVDRLTYRIAAVIICITCLFYSTMMRKRNRVRHRLFMMLVGIVLIDSLTEPISYIAVSLPLPDIIKWIVTYVNQMVYYSTHFAMIPVFVFYIIIICGVGFKASKFQKNLLKAPVYFLEVVLLTNPFTSFTFAIAGEFTYKRGIGIYIAYALSGVYLAISIYVLVRYWYCLNNTKRIAMIYFLSIGIIGTLVQMLIPEIKCELLCEAIGLAGIMLMIEKEDDRIDSSTGVYNRNAFVQDVGTLFKISRGFKVFCLRSNNLENYRKFSTYDKIDELTKKIAEFLIEVAKENSIYHTSVDVFYIIFIDKDDEAIKEYADRIISRFDDNFGDEENNIKLDATLLVADCSKQFDTLNDIFLLSNARLDDTDRKVLMGDDLDFLRRKIAIEKAIGRGIGEKKFRLNYMPIYQADNLHVKLAQATLMLEDHELGYIPHREMMEVAEGSGFIEEMQKRTLEGVCSFLSTGVDISDMQMDFVIVPVMSASMLKKEFIEEIRRQLEHFKIDPKLIALGIKESYAFFAREALSEMIKSFSSLGVRLFIIDYEAGFLGLNALTSYDFEGASININSIFKSENAGNGDIVLANRVNLLKQLGKKVIISGIDTRENYDKIINVPFDYAEGDFLSEAVTKNELQNKFWHGEHLVIADWGVERFEEDDI